MAPTQAPQAAASPTKPLDDLIYLPPKAAPIQEAINLVKDKPLKVAVCWSDSGRLSIFVRCTGVVIGRLPTLLSAAAGAVAVVVDGGGTLLEERLLFISFC